MRRLLLWCHAFVFVKGFGSAPSVVEDRCILETNVMGLTRKSGNPTLFLDLLLPTPNLSLCIPLRTKTISPGKSGKSGEKKRLWGLEGSGGHVYLDHEKRRMNLLHFWTSKNSDHYWKSREPIIFVVLGPGGRDHDSQHPYNLSLETPRHSK